MVIYIILVNIFLGFGFVVYFKRNCKIKYCDYWRYYWILFLGDFRYYEVIIWFLWVLIIFLGKKTFIGLRYRIAYISIFLEIFMYLLAFVNYIFYKIYIFRFNILTKNIFSVFDIYIYFILRGLFFISFYIYLSKIEKLTPWYL